VFDHNQFNSYKRCERKNSMERRFQVKWPICVIAHMHDMLAKLADQSLLLAPVEAKVELATCELFETTGSHKNQLLAALPPDEMERLLRQKLEDTASRVLSSRQRGVRAVTWITEVRPSPPFMND
jgi:hypothetical protein